MTSTPSNLSLQLRHKNCRYRGSLHAVRFSANVVTEKHISALWKTTCLFSQDWVTCLVGKNTTRWPKHYSVQLYAALIHTYQKRKLYVVGYSRHWNKGLFWEPLCQAFFTLLSQNSKATASLLHTDLSPCQPTPVMHVFAVCVCVCVGGGVHVCVHACNKMSIFVDFCKRSRPLWDGASYYNLIKALGRLEYLFPSSFSFTVSHSSSKKKWQEHWMSPQSLKWVRYIQRYSVLWASLFWFDRRAEVWQWAHLYKRFFSSHLQCQS